jgi:hypothetical protein
MFAANIGAVEIGDLIESILQKEELNGLDQAAFGNEVASSLKNESGLEDEQLLEEVTSWASLSPQNRQFSRVFWQDLSTERGRRRYALQVFLNSHDQSRSFLGKKLLEIDDFEMEDNQARFKTEKYELAISSLEGFPEKLSYYLISSGGFVSLDALSHNFSEEELKSFIEIKGVWENSDSSGIPSQIWHQNGVSELIWESLTKEGSLEYKSFVAWLLGITFLNQDLIELNEGQMWEMLEGLPLLKGLMLSQEAPNFIFENAMQAQEGFNVNFFLRGKSQVVEKSPSNKERLIVVSGKSSAGVSQKKSETSSVISSWFGWILGVLVLGMLIKLVLSRQQGSSHQ